MTSIFFVRHAQPDVGWQDDRTRPLTPRGLSDSLEVTDSLHHLEIDAFYSSPYRRCVDTIADCANYFQLKIHTDERLRERGQGINSSDFLEARWADFDFCEKYGETLRSVQNRNIEALRGILKARENKRVVVGTHGTALSMILNYYDASFGCDSFKRILLSLPYIIRLDFEGSQLPKMTELLKIDRGY